MAKILLVEDEINIASFIERGLKEFGHSVTVCMTGIRVENPSGQTFRPFNTGHYHA